MLSKETLSIPKWIVPTIATLMIAGVGYIIRVEVFQNSLGSDISTLKENSDKLEDEMKDLRKEKNGLSVGIATLQTDVKNLVKATNAIATKITSIEDRLTDDRRRRR